MSHSELGILIGNEVCEAPHRCHIKRLETKETLMREVIPGILFCVRCLLARIVLVFDHIL